MVKDVARSFSLYEGKLRRVFCKLFLILIGVAGLPFVLNSQTANHIETRATMSKPVHQPDHQRLTCSPAPCVLPNSQVSVDEANSTILAVNPKDANQLLSGVNDNGCGTAAYGSDDGGLSWAVNCKGFGGSLGPSVAYGIGGTGYLTGMDGYENQVLIAATHDNGQTWNPPIIAVTPLFASGVAITPWLAIDNSRTGRYHRRIYVATTQIDYNQVQSQIAVSYSADGGSTWSTSTVDKIQIKPELDYYSRIAVGPDGTVFLAWQRCLTIGPHVNCGGTRAHMWLSKSGDGGVSWSKPTEILAVRLVPDGCECSLFGSLPHTRVPIANPPLLAVDNSQGPHAGNLYVVVYNWTGKQMKVEVVSSQDGGQNWGSPVEVAALASHDQFFPGLSVSTTGAVGVSWLDRRNDPWNALYQPFAAISTDGGQSFGKNYRLARTMSNPYLVPYSFMGDYTGNAWAGKTLFVAWPDTRNAILQDFVGGLRTR